MYEVQKPKPMGNDFLSNSELAEKTNIILAVRKDFLVAQTLLARSYTVEVCFSTMRKIKHIGRLARMSVLDTEVDGSNPGSSMLCP